jgi:DtxR family Mn-dependent transcriptional regulator
LVNYAPYEFVTLTPAGVAMAEEVLRKHSILSEFLTDVLQIDAEQAEVNAHRMEHVVTDAVLDRLVAFVEYIEACPRQLAQWRNNQFVCEPDPESDLCRECENSSAAGLTDRPGTAGTETE